MKNIKIIIFTLVLILLFSAGLVFRTLSERTKFNDGFPNGNTTGNLYNAGLFCEKDGVVYFANPDDAYCLYSMDSNGSNVKKVCNDSVMYINVDDHYIYYVRNNEKASDKEYGFFSFHNNSLCRVDLDGKNIKILDVDPCIYATLIGNYIYYLHYDTTQATTLYKVKIDGSERSQVSKTYKFTCSADGQYFYYNDMDTDGSIYRFDTVTDTASLLYPCNSYKPTVFTDGNCYYLDVDHNNSLVHVNILNPNPVTVTSDSIDLYNQYGSYIYYQKYDPINGNGLWMIKNDGTENKELAHGDFKAINVTSYYIYFTDFQTGDVFYTPTSNPGKLSSFHPGNQK